MDTPIVEARALHKTYDTGAVRVDALRGLISRSRKGEMVAIMGPSGCGKTTLLNCLSGLDSIDGGEVLIEGTPLSEMSDRERTDYRARRMGFVFQFYNLIPVLTAVENVELRSSSRGCPGGEARDRALERPRPRRPRRTRGSRTRRALGRRAAARHDRPLARQRTGDRLGRRADRRPRLRERGRDRRVDAPAQPRARTVLSHRHARHLGRTQDRPHRADARRRGRRGATTGGVTCTRASRCLRSTPCASTSTTQPRSSKAKVVPGLAEQEGYEGAVALVTPDGKGMIVTFWDTEGGSPGRLGASRPRSSSAT